MARRTRIERDIEALEAKTTEALQQQLSTIRGRVVKLSDRADLIAAISKELRAAAGGAEAKPAKAAKGKKAKEPKAAKEKAAPAKPKKERAAKKAAGAATDKPKKARGPRATWDPRLPAEGETISRTWNDREHKVKVLRGEGDKPVFEYPAGSGRTYTSLSAIAQGITSKVWNGYAFFNLGAPKARKAPKAPSAHNGHAHGEGAHAAGGEPAASSEPAAPPASSEPVDLGNAPAEAGEAAGEAE